MNIIYMGTPDFAVEPLKALIKAGHNIKLVVTQPDKPKGRGKDFAFSPVKECALENNLEVFQPVKIRDEESVKYLKTFDADVFVVAAFGQILSEEILNMPKFGCINIHASLLPKLRGAAPIQWSILEGDAETGVTIMKMAKGVDTGDIYIKEAIPIESTDTGDSLFDKLMYLGAELITKALPLIEEGAIKATPQDERYATHVGKISKDMGEINWQDEAIKIERYVRGLNSWPSAYTYINGKSLKIWEAEVFEGDEKTNAYEPSIICDVTKEAFFVKTGNGLLKVKSIQLEGKKRMSVHDFLLGYHLDMGTKLGK